MIRGSSDPRRLLVVGAVGGRRNVADRVVGRALAEGAEGIVALGNLFDRWAEPLDFLHYLTDRCGALAVPLWFVEGPGDPFGMLAARPSGRLSEWVTHLQRGATWAWGGVRFLAAGGGVTLDDADARDRGAWWPQEALAPADVEACAEVGRVDVLLAHDAPWGVNVADRYKGVEHQKVASATLVREVEHRKGLYRIAERTRPQQVLCAPAGRGRGGLTFDGGTLHPVEVSVDALGDPATDEGCELLDIRPAGPLDAAAVRHPALGPEPDPEPGVEVPHPAL